MSAVTWQRTPDRRTWRAANGDTVLTVSKLSSGMFRADVEGPGGTARSPEFRTQLAAQGWAGTRAGGCQVNGEKVARVLAGLAVAVAVVAGIVSFTHIEALALAHGYALGTARLLPVSVDGLIVAASLSCLTEARARGGASRWSRAGLALGIMATLAANVAVGAHFGIIGMLVHAWPAVAFIMASEILLRMIRATGTVPSAGGAAGTVAEPEPAVPGEVARVVPPVPPSVPLVIPAAVPVPVDGVPAVPGKRARTVASGRTPAARQQAPEKVFAAELAAGELPSLRAIKERMHVGTDRARVIHAGLASLVQEAPPKAAL